MSTNLFPVISKFVKANKKANKIIEHDTLKLFSSINMFISSQGKLLKSQRVQRRQMDASVDK